MEFGVFLERTRILSGIQFTKHVIKSSFVEAHQFFSSNQNVILTRTHAASTQAKLQQANAERERLVFPYEFAKLHVLDIETRTNSDLGLCTISVLAKRMPPHSGDL